MPPLIDFWGSAGSFVENHLGLNDVCYHWAACLLKQSLFTLPKLEKVDFEKYSLNNPDHQVNVSKR